jgi:hypothetical protein
MPLHGQFQRDTKDIKTEQSWDWLRLSGLKRETESLLIAAQDQALNTNSIKKSIYKTVESDKCRICGQFVENVTHLISACTPLAQKEYKRRHDKVAANLHWHLSQKYGFDVCEKWYQHNPSAVIENDSAKILWDFTIQTDRVIEHRKPDITVLDKTNRRCFIVDVAIPGDHKIAEKQLDKITRYSELRVELARLWNVNASVIPIVIGALGSIPKDLSKHIKALEIKPHIPILQKTAILSTSHILRKILVV